MNQLYRAVRQLSAPHRRFVVRDAGLAAQDNGGVYATYATTRMRVEGDGITAPDRLHAVIRETHSFQTN